MLFSVVIFLAIAGTQSCHLLRVIVLRSTPEAIRVHLPEMLQCKLQPVLCLGRHDRRVCFETMKVRRLTPSWSQSLTSCNVSSSKASRACEGLGFGVGSSKPSASSNVSGRRASALICARSRAASPLLSSFESFKRYNSSSRSSLVRRSSGIVSMSEGSIQRMLNCEIRCCSMESACSIEAHTRSPAFSSKFSNVFLALASRPISLFSSNSSLARLR